jgi:hypothetical protein
LQASRASDTETLQSQVNKAAKKRLSLSGLEILHGRLFDAAQHSFELCEFRQRDELAHHWATVARTKEALGIAVAGPVYQNPVGYGARASKKGASLGRVPPSALGSSMVTLVSEVTTFSVAICPLAVENGDA